MENNYPASDAEMIHEMTRVLYETTVALEKIPNKQLAVYEQIRKNAETLLRMYQEFEK